MDLENTDKEKTEKLYKIVIENIPKNPYHNIAHTTDVVQFCKKFAEQENLTSYETFILEVAGLLHDIVHTHGQKDNEEKSAEFARKILPDIGYSAKDVEEVARLIMATKLPTNPQDVLEKIICDADLCILGMDNFFERNELLRQENSIPKKEWYTKQAKFMEKIEYYTPSAKKLLGSKKEENTAKMKELAAAYQGS